MRAFIVATMLVGSLWLGSGVEAADMEAQALQTRLDALHYGCPDEVRMSIVQEATMWMQRCRRVPNPLACEHALLGEFSYFDAMKLHQPNLSCRELLKRFLDRPQEIWR